MGYWDYKNVGASANSESIEHIEKIFEYIGYASEPDSSPDGDECSFDEPDVYGCEYSADARASGKIKKCFGSFDEKDLLYLLNALFPKTTIYVHKSEGNNTSDTWENHDIVYDTDDMTCYCEDSYTDYGGGGPNDSESSKESFVLKPPKMEHVKALLDLSMQDGNNPLAALLQELIQKIERGFVAEATNKNTAPSKKKNDLFVIKKGLLKKYKGNEEHVEIPDGVTAIGMEAFSGCYNIESITIPESVTSIGIRAFHDCGHLEKIAIPKGVTEIGAGAFSRCLSLQNINIPEGVSVLEFQTFGSTKLKSITIPSNITSMGEKLFSSCYELQTVIIQDGVEEIGDQAFYYCENLTEISIPASVHSLGLWVFVGCKNLKKAVIPKALEELAKKRDIFTSCKQLTDIQYV